MRMGMHRASRPFGLKRTLSDHRRRRASRGAVPPPRPIPVTAVNTYRPPRTSGDSVDSYFRQIASAPLLTREGETALARRIEEAELEIRVHAARVPGGRARARAHRRGARGGASAPRDVTRNASEDDPEAEAAARVMLLKQFAPIRSLGPALARRRPGRPFGAVMKRAKATVVDIRFARAAGSTAWPAGFGTLGRR